MLLISALTVSACLPAVLAWSNDCTQPTATIADGVVIGTQVSLPTATAAVNEFLGIPFAKSPPERFSPPQPPSPWSSPLTAQAWKPACIQQFNYPLAAQQFAEAVFNNPGGPPPQESEDCLYLNVYAPAAPPPPGGRAVLYWIYGGSLEFGTAGQIAYNGSSFAAYQDVIIVTVNYRTNVFGFPNSPELHLTGQNLGFLDQRAGLDWVQKNIAAFGGDPQKVTIFGQSAGAFSVDALITSFPKGSNPPFRAAILESGQLSYRPAQYASSVPAWDQLAALLNCTGSSSNLTCIRAAPATTIQTIIEQNILTFNPVADNVTLVSDPAKRRTSGQIAVIPVMTGSTAQEGRVFEVGTTNLTTFFQTYFSAVPSFWPVLTAAYPLGQAGLNSAYDVASQIFTELIFQCPAALFANASAAAGIPTWRYYFNASFPNTQPVPNLVDLGVYHASEIPLVFGTYPPYNVTAQEFALSQFMQGAWARFAKNPQGGPGWNAVGSASAFFEAPGDLDLADLGADGTSGATIIRQSAVDFRCRLYEPIYQAALGQPA